MLCACTRQRSVHDAGFSGHCSGKSSCIQLRSPSHLQVGELTAAILEAKHWPSGEALVSVQTAISMLLPIAERLILDLKPLVGCTLLRIKT